MICLSVCLIETYSLIRVDKDKRVLRVKDNLSFAENSIIIIDAKLKFGIGSNFWGLYYTAQDATKTRVILLVSSLFAVLFNRSRM